MSATDLVRQCFNCGTILSDSQSTCGRCGKMQPPRVGPTKAGAGSPGSIDPRDSGFVELPHLEEKVKKSRARLTASIAGLRVAEENSRDVWRNYERVLIECERLREEVASLREALRSAEKVANDYARELADRGLL